MSNPKGLLVGAYERDNFGDILFLTSTRSYLGDIDSTATAPFAGDTTAVGGTQVDRFVDAVSGSVPYIWTVGGEVGATSLLEAGQMSSSEAPAVSEYASPYLPRPSMFPGTRNAVFIVNSVGVSGAARLVGKRKVEAWSSLREADYVSVRDTDSLRFLKRIGVEAVAAPDLVHTRALEFDHAYVGRSSYALFQMKTKYVHEIGIESIVRALGESRALRAYKIRFFSAGEATGHDSTPLLQEISFRLNELYGWSRSEVSTASTAEEKVHEIAGCSLWIGTSLHGMILSTSFAIPRVGLLLKKIRRYTSSWGIEYPADSSLEDLDDAVIAALDTHARDGGEKQALRLGRKAESNIESAIGRLAQCRVSARNPQKVDTALARSTSVTEVFDRAKVRTRDLVNRVIPNGR